MRSLTPTLRSLPVLLGGAGLIALVGLSGCDQNTPESESDQPAMTQQSNRVKKPSSRFSAAKSCTASVSPCRKAPPSR